MAPGYQNPFSLKQAKQKQQSLYNGKVLLEKHDPPAMYDSEETLQLAQESRLKMKQLNKEIKSENYAKINQLSEIKRLQAPLGDQKGNSKYTLCVSNTWSLSLVTRNDETVELEFQVLNYAKENAHLKTTYKNLFDSINVTRAQTKTIIDSLQNKLHDTIYENTKLRAQLFDKVFEQEDTTKGTSTNTKFAIQSTERKPSLQPLRNNFVVRQPNAFQSEHTKFSKTQVPQKVDETNNLINPSKTSREDKFVPINKVRASIWINLITVSQPHVITKKGVNSNLNGLSSTRVDNTAKTRRPQPRSNIKNDRIPSESKSSCINNKEVEVEEHPRNLLLSKNKKHMSSECNNIKLAIRNDKSEVVCAMCKQCLVTANLDVCVLNYVNGMNSRDKKQKENFLETVRFGNDHIAAILGFGDLQCGNILIAKVYFIEGLGHNLFLVGQFCDSDLEVAFRRDTCFFRNLEGVDLLKGNRTTNLYTINLHDMPSASPICLMARATSTKSWLWHKCLSHLNFDTINDLAKNDLVTGLPKFKYHKEHLCPSCEQGKSKRASHPPKPVPNSKQRLHLLHIDFCGLIRIASINGKRYVLVIVDDYSRYTWVHFLRSKDEAPKVIKTFLKRINVLLQSPVIIIRTDNGTKFKNQILKEYFDSVGISHQASSVRTPQQNGVVEQRNQMLVEAARTIFFFSRASLFLWAEEIATACYTQNHSIIHRRVNKTPYELINGRKPDISFLHVFRALCYPKNDREDIRRLGVKAMYDDYIGGQPSAAPRTTLAAQAPQVLQTPTTSTTIADTALTPTNSSSQATTPLQPETIADNVPNAMFDGNTFVNPFATPSTSAADSSSLQYVDPSNMHTFYQPYPHEYQWTKDYPLEQVIGEPSRPILTRNQLRSDGDMCIYALTVSTMKSKNVKEAMTDPAWIESMQEELLQFKRLGEWVLVPDPDNIKPLTLKWLLKNKHDEENTVIQNKTRLVVIGYRQ
ncbi:retrovirus-related pol polyprotein from transposon TNT 1-94 [Tanacetum coccineum]